MPDYQKLYLHLFNAVTDALRDLEKGNGDEAEQRLIRAQQECEEIYIES